MYTTCTKHTNLFSNSTYQAIQLQHTKLYNNSTYQTLLQFNIPNSITLQHTKLLQFNIPNSIPLQHTKLYNTSTYQILQYFNISYLNNYAKIIQTFVYFKYPFPHISDTLITVFRCPILPNSRP